MRRRIGAAGRYLTEQSTRFYQRLLPTKMLMHVAIGVLAGAFLSGLLIRSVSLLVAAGLGAIAVWCLRKTQNRRIDRDELERLNWRTETTCERVVAAKPDRPSNDFVVFHDFNTVRGCFDHW